MTDRFRSMHCVLALAFIGTTGAVAATPQSTSLYFRCTYVGQMVRQGMGEPRQTGDINGEEFFRIDLEKESPSASYKITDALIPKNGTWQIESKWCQWKKYKDNDKCIFNINIISFDYKSEYLYVSRDNSGYPVSIFGNVHIDRRSGAYTHELNEWDYVEPPSTAAVTIGGASDGRSYEHIPIRDADPVRLTERRNGHCEKTTKPDRSAMF